MLCYSLASIKSTQIESNKIDFFFDNSEDVACCMQVKYPCAFTKNDARQTRNVLFSSEIMICVSVRLFLFIGSTRMICTMFASTNFDVHAAHKKTHRDLFIAAVHAAAAACNRYVQRKKRFYCLFLTAAQLERKRHDENRH